MHDIVAISELRRILKLVEARVPLGASIHDGGLGDMNTLNTPGPFEAGLLSLANLKHTHRFVMQLEKTMRPIISQLSERLLEPSRRFGIDKLPDSVLALIFEISIREATYTDNEYHGTLVDTSKSRFARRALALTSKRFSVVIRSTPSIWAFVFAQAIEPRKFERTPPQSKSAPLTVTLVTTSSFITDLNLLKSVHRCRALLLRSARYDTSGARSNEDVLAKDEPARILPIMEALDIRDVNDPNVFFDTWQTPNLKHLYLHDALPPQRIMPILTTLVIRYCVGLDAVPSIVAHLRYAKKLQRLALFFNDNISYLDERAVTNLQALALEGERGDIDLPHLTSLEVVVDFEGPVEALAFRVVRLLTDPMQVPELRDLKLRYKTENMPAEGDKIPFCDKRLGKLQTLSLRIMQTAKRCKSRPKTQRDVDDFEGEARKNWVFIIGLLAGRPSLAEVSIFSQKCWKLFDFINACPNIRLFRFEGSFLDNVETLSETVKGVCDSKPNLQYCDVRKTAFTGIGKNKVFVRFDDNVGPTRVVWKEERFVKD